MTSDAEIVVGIRGRVGGGGKRVKRELDDIANSGDRATNVMGQLQKALGALAVGQVLRTSTSQALSFSNALAEVSTLLDDTTGEMEKLTQAAKEQALQFGSNPAAQTKAFYQIISAGAENAAEATVILTAANKLAVGGVTDITTAADGLTTVLNAYGDEVESATAVSDAMFVAMRAGKTTIGELSSGIGKVAPLAVSAGVAFDELLASVSALTKGGISTQESITGVRAILAAVVKPTSEAAKLAESLGIEFSAAGLKAKGFSSFLEDLIDKTGGSTDQLAKLFGGVEALVPILALSGKAGVDFNAILGDMTNKAGATETAFNKIAESPGFKIGRVMAAIRLKALELGDAIVAVLTPAAVSLVDNMDGLQRIFTVLAITTIPLLVTGIGTHLVGAVTALSVAISLNPLFAAGILLVASTAALVTYSDKIKVTEDGVTSLRDVFAVLWSDISKGVKNAIQDLKIFFEPIINFLDRLASHPMMNRFGSNVKSAIGGTNYVQSVIGRAQERTESPLFGEGDQNRDILKNALSGGPSTFQEIFGTTNNNDNEQIDTSIQKIEEITVKNAANSNEIERQTKLLDTLSNITSGFFKSALTGADGFKGALKSVIKQLADLAFQMTVLEPIKNNLFGSGSGKNDIFGSILSGVAGMFTGGGTSASIAQASARGVANPALFGPGFASGGSMILGGNSGIDQNQLSLNGRPIARVGRGETLSVSPAGKSGGGGGQPIIINQTLNVSTGVAESVAAEFATFMPVVEERIKSGVQEAQARGIK